MKRLRWLMCGAVLTMCTQAAVAQHHGQGGSGSSSGRGQSGSSNSDELKDFKKAVAVQASPDQVTQFRELVKSTEAAKKNTQDFLLLASNSGKADAAGNNISQHDLSTKMESLAGAVEEVQTENEQFLRTFSSTQKSLLKDETKKLGKANSEVAKQGKTLNAGEGDKRDAVEKLDKALEDLAGKQAALGTVMGIPAEKSGK